MNLNFDQVKAIDWQLLLPVILPIVVINLILISIALVDMYLQREYRDNKLIWVFIILFFNTLGPVLYFVLGRRKGRD